MKKQEREFPRLSAWLKRSSKLLHLTRDEIVLRLKLKNYV